MVCLCLNVNPTLTRTQGFIQHQLESWFFFKLNWNVTAGALIIIHVCVSVTNMNLSNDKGRNTCTSILKWNYEWKIKGVFTHGVINDKKISTGTFPKKYTYKQTFQILFLMRPLIKRHVWIEACWQQYES